jgi:hypothetical protein
MFFDFYAAALQGNPTTVCVETEESMVTPSKTRIREKNGVINVTNGAFGGFRKV